MALHFKLLDADQIWGDDALEVMKKYGTKVVPTDLTVILGGRRTSKDNRTSEGDLTCFSWSKEGDGVGCDGKDKLFSTSSLRWVSTRPALPPSEASKISPSKITTLKSGIRIAEYGEYPQTVAVGRASTMLEKLYESKSLHSTGKSYTFDSSDPNDEDRRFRKESYPEYEMDGKRYIRVPGRPCDENSSVLSTGKRVQKGKPYWIEVQPIEWLMDKSGWMVSKKCLFAGIRFNSLGDWWDTSLFFRNGTLQDDPRFVKGYLNGHFAEEINPSEHVTRRAFRDYRAEEQKIPDKEWEKMQRERPKNREDIYRKLQIDRTDKEAFYSLTSSEREYYFFHCLTKEQQKDLSGSLGYDYEISSKYDHRDNDSYHASSAKIIIQERANKRCVAESESSGFIEVQHYTFYLTDFKIDDDRIYASIHHGGGLYWYAGPDFHSHLALNMPSDVYASYQRFLKKQKEMEGKEVVPPADVVKALTDFVAESDLQKNMASSDPDRKKLRGHIARIHAEEQFIRSEVKKGIRSLAPEKEDPESPRYKRAQELKEHKQKYGFRSAIEAAKTLRERDDLGDQEGKDLRKRLYEYTQEAEALKAKRQAAAKKLSEPVPERDTEAQRIHGLRRDVEARQRDLEKAQEELKKAKGTYGDLRKRFKPKQKPQATVQSTSTKPAPKPAPKSFWGRLFKRGGNDGNG